DADADADADAGDGRRARSFRSGRPPARGRRLAMPARNADSQPGWDNRLEYRPAFAHRAVSPRPARYRPRRRRLSGKAISLLLPRLLSPTPDA
ncbi:hypothetical protein, partial [Burkholderia pseudomallei]